MIVLFMVCHFNKRYILAPGKGDGDGDLFLNLWRLGSRTWRIHIVIRYQEDRSKITVLQ